MKRLCRSFGKHTRLCLSGCLKVPLFSTPSVPVSQTTLRTLYIFVEITIDPLHLSLSIRRNFPSSKTSFHRTILSEKDNKVVGKGIGATLEIGIEEEPPIPNEKKEEVKEDTPTRLALVSTIQFISAVQDLRDALSESLPPISNSDPPPHSSDSTALTTIKPELRTQSTILRARAEEIGLWRGKYDVVVPQVKPLSPGEVLGCTAPKLDDNVDALM